MGKFHPASGEIPSATSPPAKVVPPVTSLTKPPDAAIPTDGQRPKRKGAFHGRFQPEPIPADLVVPVMLALLARDAKTILALLRDHIAQAWIRRNSSINSDYISTAFQAPMRALAAKIHTGEMQSIAGLEEWIEKIVAKTAGKYGRKSYRRNSPTVGFGRPKSETDDPAMPMFVTGVPQLETTPSREATPAEYVQGIELGLRIEEILQSINTDDRAIFEAVQAYRGDYGVSGAFPHVANLPVADHLWTPFPCEREIMKQREQREKAVRTKVRRIWLKVWRFLAEQLIAAGYDVPISPSKKRKFRKPNSGENPP